MHDGFVSGAPRGDGGRPRTVNDALLVHSSIDVTAARQCRIA